MSKRWWPGGKHQSESSGSGSGRSGRRRGAGLPPLAPPPPPPSSAPRGVRIVGADPRRAGPQAGGPAAKKKKPTPGKRYRRYVRVEEAQWHWENAVPVRWSDVHLPDNWHLNPQRIPVPPIPTDPTARAVEIARRRSLLPNHLLDDPAYAASSPYWDQWFREEHDERRRSYFAPAPEPPSERTEYPALPEGMDDLDQWLEVDSDGEAAPMDEDDDVDDAMKAAMAASRQAFVDDERRRWEMVVQDALPPLPPHGLPPQGPPPPPPPPQGQPGLAWWQVLAQEEEAYDPPEEEHEEPVRLPPELFGQSWVFTTVPQLPPEEPQDAILEEPGTPPRGVPMEQPPPPPTHLWDPPPYVVLSDEEGDED